MQYYSIWKSGKYGWLIFGLLSSLGYGMWGFFDKFSTFQSPIISNIITYTVTLMMSIVFAFGYFRRPSQNAIISGLCGSIINTLVLFGLLSNQLILLYPFVSFGAIIFMILYSIHFKPKRTKTQRNILYAGMFLSIFGLFLCGIGLSGGFTNVLNTYSFNLHSVILGLAISIFTGLWIYFAYLTISQDGFHPRSAAIWVFLGSFIAAVAAIPFDLTAIIDTKTSISFIYPVAAGLSMFIAEISAYYAFKSIDVKSTVEQIIVVVLANSEIIPIIILSFFFLNETSTEGFVGAIVVFLGLVLLNGAREFEL